MTAREGNNIKLNWTLDKVLMGVLIFLAVKTYGSIEDTISKVNDLDKRQAVIEEKVKSIERKIQ